MAAPDGDHDGPAGRGDSSLEPPECATHAHARGHAGNRLTVTCPRESANNNHMMSQQGGTVHMMYTRGGMMMPPAAMRGYNMGGRGGARVRQPAPPQLPMFVSAANADEEDVMIVGTGARGTPRGVGGGGQPQAPRPPPGAPSADPCRPWYRPPHRTESGRPVARVVTMRNGSQCRGGSDRPAGRRVW